MLIPRNGRRNVRRAAHRPSSVLSWTSRIPSPSSSRAHSRWPGVWFTVACPRPSADSRAYPDHSSVYTVAPSSVCSVTNAIRVSWSVRSTTSRTMAPVSRLTTPTTGGRSLAKFPCPRRLLARRRGGSSGFGCRTPFFPRILEHLVRFGLRAGDRADLRGGSRGAFLEPVPQIQQVHPIAPQFSRQLSGRGSLREPAEDQNPLGRGPTGAVERGSGVRIEHPTAMGASVVQDRCPMPGLNPHPIGPVAPRARQTVGVQQIDQIPVARAWVHQVHDREVHLPASKTTATQHRRTLTLDRGMGKDQFHPDGLMSQHLKFGDAIAECLCTWIVGRKSCGFDLRPDELGAEAHFFRVAGGKGIRVLVEPVRVHEPRRVFVGVRDHRREQRLLVSARLKAWGLRHRRSPSARPPPRTVRDRRRRPRSRGSRTPGPPRSAPARPNRR
ncbi:hypothetical protein FTUN_3130 [Frigoriglobus tundricola]|uniref:Uncharacterized protein n=1 Tax=Frigoriglobus tundricola TaxID=2774151 RepID=A0A6M5YQ79_9BACT|nr:hypothetical protein FTUN_3130 [Frigoriglobus tundricola]